MLAARCLRSGFAFLLKVSNSTFSGSPTFHTTTNYFAIDKVLLSKLRKKTGFSLSHCKNALEQNENDLEKSEKWLLQEAQAHGWAKASKLGSRATPQGLVGVYIDKNVGGLVEVNCETDFVAKNEDFRELVNTITKEVTLSSSDQAENTTSKIFISKEELEKIQTKEGKSLADLIALSVGKIGENIQLTRAVKISSPPELQLRGYVHPPNEKGVLAGKYATVVAFKNANDDQLARQLCAHIIGMNPTEIGTFEDLENVTSCDQNETEISSSNSSQGETAKSSSSSSSSEDEDSSEEAEMDVIEEEKEEILLHQKFLADQDVTVGQILKENDLDIIDFVRLECGETQKEIQ